MNERRKTKIQIGRRKTDIPVLALEQFKNDMTNHVAETIERVVNGKINSVHNELSQYIKDDTAWKLRAEPTIKAFENTSWLFRFFISALKIIGLLGTAGAAILFIKSFINRP